MYFTLFAYIGDAPIYRFDESRLVVNAMEMSKTHDYLVTTFLFKPEDWNTKPPLLIILGSLSYSLFGFSELTFRLWSAFFALITVLVGWRFYTQTFGSQFFAFVFSLILITSAGFVDIHRTRTFDYDTLLTLGLFLSTLFFYKWYQTASAKYSILFWIAITLTVLTKGVAGLFFMPTFLAFSLYKVKSKSDFMKFWSMGFFSLFIILGYYFLRDYYQEGYIQLIMKNELGNRFLNTLEGHSRPFYFYFLQFYNINFFFWAAFFVITLGMIYFKVLSHPFLKLGMALFFQFFITISIGQTRIEWYDMPIYPIVSLMVAFMFQTLIQSYSAMKSPLLFTIILISLLGFYNRLNTNILEKVNAIDNYENQLIKQIKNHPDFFYKYKNLNFYWSEYEAQNIPYIYTLDTSRVQYTILDSFKSGIAQVVYMPNDNANFSNDTNFRIIDSMEHVKVFIKRD